MTEKIETENIETPQPRAIGITSAGSILKFIFSNWEVILLVLVITSALATYYKLKIQVSYYKSEVATLTNDNKILKENEKVLKETITTQNESISVFTKKSQASDKVIDNLQKDIALKEQDNKALANKLKQLPTPQTCEESIEYLNNNIIGRLTWND